MKTYSFTHLSDGALLRHLAATVAGERGATAEVLASIAEVDARRLYAPAGYASMYLYCVHELHLSEQAAYRRILAARTARQFSAIFAAIAEGRLHLSAVTLLAPYLTADTAEGLLAAATHKTKAQIEQLLAERFPRADMPARVQAIAPFPATEQLAPESLGAAPGPSAPGCVGAPPVRLFPGIVGTPAEPPAPVSVAPAPRPRVAPLSPDRFGVQFTMGQSMHGKLQEAQELLGHQVPSGDIAAVLELALDALIGKLKKAKFAATDRPRPGRRRSLEGGRHIPADVRRAVWERDGGQCTYVSDAGHRCDARKGLEFDHLDPVARGGHAAVGRIRLRCRAHNQLEAERVFGTEFMNGKREARRAAAAARTAMKAVALLHQSVQPTALHPAPSPG